MPVTWLSDISIHSKVTHKPHSALVESNGNLMHSDNKQLSGKHGDRLRFVHAKKIIQICHSKERLYFYTFVTLSRVRPSKEM